MVIMIAFLLLVLTVALVIVVVCVSCRRRKKSSGEGDNHVCKLHLGVTCSSPPRITLCICTLKVDSCVLGAWDSSLVLSQSTAYSRSSLKNQSSVFIVVSECNSQFSTILLRMFAVFLENSTPSLVLLVDLVEFTGQRGF